MPTTTPAADITAVRNLLQDNDTDDRLLADADVDQAVQQAVARYSTLVPNLATVNLSGAGSRYFNRTGLTGFVPDWSTIESVEYPARAVSATVTPIFLDLASDIKWYRDGTNIYLWLPNHRPSTGQTVRVTFTVPRALTGTSDTIVSAHKDAVLCLAAAICCNMLATKMASAHEPLVNADVASFSAGQQRFRDQAKEWLRYFNERVGPAAKEDVRAASILRDFDTTGYRGLRPRLTHFTRR